MRFFFVKTWCYELTTKKHIDHCHCQFNNDEESSHDKHSNQDIFDIILYCFDITTSKRAVGHQTKSIPNQKNRRSNKSYVEDPLQIRLDIFSDPLCSIRELVLLWVSSLFIIDFIHFSILNFLIFICTISDCRSDFFRWASSIYSSSLLVPCNHSKTASKHEKYKR